jgi:glucose 1-dehydrogenase
MRAVAVFPASREVKLIELAEPVITRPGQVKLRMLDVGICGTDKEICTFAHGSPPPGEPYLVIGHEALGEVAGRSGRADGAQALSTCEMPSVPGRPAGLLRNGRFS